MFKNVKWANRELPGLSHEELEKLTDGKLGMVVGGQTQGNINKENGIGIFGLNAEERAANAKIGNRSFWDNATPEEIKAKYEKSSKSIKQFIEENGYWYPHEHITPESKEIGIKNMIEGKLKNKELRIKELYDNIETNEWFTIEFATSVLSSYSKQGATKSTTRRMIHYWKEATKYYEWRKTETNELGKKYMQWRKLILKS